MVMNIKITVLRDVVRAINGSRWHLLGSRVFIFQWCYFQCFNMPWLWQLVAGFPPQHPGFNPSSGNVGFVVDKVTLWFPLPILISTTALQSSSSSIIQRWYDRPNSGRCTKWTQSQPHPKKKKTKKYSALKCHALSFRIIIYVEMNSQTYSVIISFIGN
jgi:hypothetical protein